MVVVFIKTSIQSKMMNTTTMIPYRRFSWRELAIVVWMEPFPILKIAWPLVKAHLGAGNRFGGGGRREAGGGGGGEVGRL